MASRIRVLCVDDMPDLTAVIRLVIESEPEMQCVGCLTSANELIEEVRRIDPFPHVVLLDATMPGKSPLEVMSQLHQEFPKTRTIVFSGHSDEAFMDRALDAGAWGCVSKNDPPETIMQAVRDVVCGHIFFPRLIHPRLRTA